VAIFAWACCIFPFYLVHLPLSSLELLTFFRNSRGGRRHLGFSVNVNLPFRRADSVVFVFCAKLGTNICYSHWDRRRYASDLYLMTSRELTSGFDFWSCGHLRMAVMHFPIEFGAYIFIQYVVIDIFPKFKMAVAAILYFQVMWIWPFRRVDSVVFVFYTTFGSNICYSHWDRRTYVLCDDVTRINFRFRPLVNWPFSHSLWNLVHIP